MAQVKGTDSVGSSSIKKNTDDVIQRQLNTQARKAAQAKDLSTETALKEKIDIKNSNKNNTLNKGNSSSSGSSSSGGSSSGSRSSGGGSTRSKAETAEIKNIAPPSLEAVASAAILSNVAPSVVSPTKVTTTSTNISAKQLSTWKERVDRAISRDLLTSLKKSYEDVVQIAKITSTQDGGELSTRYKSLSKDIDKSYQQLTKFMRNFDSSLTEYISTMEKAEQKISAQTKSTTDKFSEAASKLSNLKM